MRDIVEENGGIHNTVAMGSLDKGYKNCTPEEKKHIDQIVAQLGSAETGGEKPALLLPSNPLDMDEHYARIRQRNLARLAENIERERVLSREPEKLNNAHKSSYDYCPACGWINHDSNCPVALAESSLSSPPPRFHGEWFCPNCKQKTVNIYLPNSDEPSGDAHFRCENCDWYGKPSFLKSSSLTESGPESAHSGKQNIADKSELLPTQLPKEK